MGEKGCDIQPLPGKLEDLINPTNISPIPPQVRKSKHIYEVSYKRLVKFCEEQQAADFSENVLLSYFHNLSKLQYKSPTLFLQFSMLKAQLNEKHNININTYTKLISFLEQHGEGYTAKKWKSLTKRQFDDFLQNAPDSQYLATKVILIIGVHRACKCDQLLNLTVHDISDLGDVLLVRIRDRKSNKPQRFTITGDFYINLYRKYAALRPKDINTSKLFLRYRNNKCYRIGIGRTKISQIAKDVASFLHLPNPSDYTGHCFRKTSAILWVDKRAKPSPLMEHYNGPPVELNIHHRSHINRQSLEHSHGKQVKNQDFVIKSMSGRIEEKKEVSPVTNETIFVKGEPSVLIYYRDNATMAEDDPLETVQVKLEPKTEPVECSEIGQDELVIKEELLMCDSAMTDYRISC